MGRSLCGHRGEKRNRVGNACAQSAAGAPFESSTPWKPTLVGTAQGGPVRTESSDGEEHWDDRAWVMKRVTGSPGSLKHAPSVFKYDKDIDLAAVKKIGNALCHASDALRNAKTIVEAAIEKPTGTALRHASQELQGDRELVLTAVRQHGCALEYAAQDLWGDREVVLAAVQ